MEYIWSLFALFAGYVVIKLYEYDNRFKLNEYIFNELKSQVKVFKYENEFLRLEINRLQHQQELSKDKMVILNTDLKKRDDVLKDIEKEARFVHEELKNTAIQLDKLAKQVTVMDRQIQSMSKEFNNWSKKTNLNRDHGGKHDDYKGGSVVLNTIKWGINFIIRKICRIQIYTFA